MSPKTLFTGVLLAFVFVATEMAYAACTYSVITVDGRTVTCMTCCSGSVCNTTCF